MSNYFTNNRGQWMLSDYGLDPLKNIYPIIFNAKTPEEKLYAVDKALMATLNQNALYTNYKNADGYLSADGIEANITSATWGVLSAAYVVKDSDSFAKETFLQLRLDDSCWNRLLRYLRLKAPQKL